jgi:subtilisin-like proprotein convertase family protein
MPASSHQKKSSLIRLATVAWGLGALVSCDAPPSHDALESSSGALTGTSDLWLGDPITWAAGATVELQQKLDSRLWAGNDGLAIDFVHWGKDTATSVDRVRGKALLANNPGYTTLVAGSTVSRSTTNAPKFVWWDGSPSKTGSTASGISVTGKNNGFKVVIPAPPVPNDNVCVLYGQVLTNAGTTSQGTLSVSLADNSAPAASKIIKSGAAFGLDFQFGSIAATNLNVSWKLTTDGGGGKLVMYAVLCDWWEDQPFQVTTGLPGNGVLPQFRSNGANTIDITANEITGGPYTKVDFYEDGTLVGTDTSTPYQLTRTPAPGLHYYQARGTRADGRTLLSGFSRAPVWIESTQLLRAAIPDNNTTGLTFNFPVAGAATGLLVADVIVSSTITHTFDGDLVLDAIHPSGTKVNLANRAGGAGDDMFVRFWDKAPVGIASGVAPFDAEWAYKPQSSTGPFLGAAVNGTWKLKVTDVAVGDTGTWHESTLYVLPN